MPHRRVHDLAHKTQAVVFPSIVVKMSSVARVLARQLEQLIERDLALHIQWRNHGIARIVLVGICCNGGPQVLFQQHTTAVREVKNERHVEHVVVRHGPFVPSVGFHEVVGLDKHANDWRTYDSGVHNVGVAVDSQCAVAASAILEPAATALRLKCCRTNHDVLVFL